MTHLEKEPEELARHVREIWERNASWWDDYMGEGREFQNALVGPATERLLQLRPDETMLDVACGNGGFARRMAQLGAQVVAFDFSEGFIERARARTTELADRITYRVLDAADEKDLLALGKAQFDAAVCTMALMDMVTIAPLLRALRQLLKPGGRFVFSVLHPCFNSSDGLCRMVEEEDRDGKMHTRRAVKVWRYIEPSVARGLGVVGQPEPQLYFHRPLSVLLTMAFEAGFVLDGLEEPVFDGTADTARDLSWSNFWEIPPVLVARLRPLQHIMPTHGRDKGDT